MSIVETADPSIATSNTGDPKSFGYPTVRERWPKILIAAEKEINEIILGDYFPKRDSDAGIKIIASFLELKSNILSDVALEPLPDDGGSDIKSYNEELKTFGRITWQHAPWLYTECHLYRLIRTFFSLSTPYWQKFDVFGTSKQKSLLGSKKGVIELVKRFHGVLNAVDDENDLNEEMQKALFEEVIQICLWGNATDLSLLTSLSVEELDSRQGKAVRDSSKAHVLVDDTEQAWRLLTEREASGKTSDVHIVLDNSGFELLADLVFVGYLMETGYAEVVVLHGKQMPWFVSDVTPNDFEYLISGFINGTIYPDLNPTDAQDLRQAGIYWRNLMKSNKLFFRADAFWTTQHPFGRMPVVNPDLYAELSSADLIVYKGDLNYRKLTYDGVWPHDKPFHETLGPLATKHDGRGVRTLALRTAKADVFVGLKPGQADELEEGWTRTGKYALVSYWDGKS